MRDGDSHSTYVVAQLGSRLHYSVPRVLNAARRLERFYTDICASKGFIPWLRFMPESLQPGYVKKVLGRIPQGIPGQKVIDFKPQAMLSRFQAKRMASKTAIVAHNMETARTFCRNVVESGFGNATGVYAFKSAAFEIFEHARSLGLRTVLDQTGALSETYWQMSAEEEDRFPGWQVRGASGTPELEAYCKREHRERELADIILCPSQYVIDSLKPDGVDSEKCKLIPYGYDMPENAGHTKKRRSTVLRVLIVGSVRLEKGIQYAASAAGRLGCGFEFRAAGEVHLLPKARQQVQERIRLMGQLPWPELQKQYQWADVLLFPTLSDSFGRVQLEAMSRGIPVITTPNAGEVVSNGRDGFIVPIRDADAIAEILDLLASYPSLLESCSKEAYETARAFHMKRYDERLLSALGVRECAGISS